MNFQASNLDGNSCGGNFRCFELVEGFWFSIWVGCSLVFVVGIRKAINSVLAAALFGMFSGQKEVR